MNLSTLNKDAEVRKQLRRNLRHWYSVSTDQERREGQAWYSQAEDFCSALAEKYNVPQEIVAGVVSALSPNNKWERNKVDAELVIFSAINNVDPSAVKVCTYNANKMKAFAIAKGDRKILSSSPKTFSFAMNVGKRDSNYVTIDKWHLRACQTQSKAPVKCQESVTNKQYETISTETIHVAKELGVNPIELQATIWVCIKNHWNR
jgi:hypothetical protein